MYVLISHHDLAILYIYIPLFEKKSPVQMWSYSMFYGTSYLQLLSSFPTDSDLPPPISLGISLAGASAAVSFARFNLATSDATLSLTFSCIDTVDSVRNSRDPPPTGPPTALVVRWRAGTT